MKKLTLLLVAAAAMVFSTAFAKTAQAVGAGKMKLSASAGFTMYSPKEGDSSKVINFMGKGINTPFGSMGGAAGNAFTFLDSQVSGFTFAYGIDDKMHVALALPVFSMFMNGDDTDKALFGPAQLGFVYSDSMGAFDLTANPYLNLPFMEMYPGAKAPQPSDNNFKQPIGFGLAVALDSPEASKIIWGFWMNFAMNLEKKDGDVVTYPKGMYLSFTGIGGYKINEKMAAKLHINYDAPNLQAEGDMAPGFAEGNLSFKGVFDMKLAPNMGISTGLYYTMGLGDNNWLKDITVIGLSLGYNMTF